MEITHFCNSFISANFPKSKIYCDPWLGTTKDNGWISHPIDYESINKISKPDYIYISHLHCDHFDEKTLLKIQNNNQIAIIKDYKIKTLRRKLEKVGFSKILELKPWKKYSFNNDFEVAIIPQMSSNSSEKEEQIDYDLDTSIIIKCKKTNKIFYNNVDNPLSISDLKKVNNFIKKIFKSKVNVLCFGVGAASEYPQCFLNIKRSQEKVKVIKNCVIKLKKILKIFNPDIFFPAGGTYKIYGKFFQLNKFIAQASFSEIKKNKPKKTLFVNLIGGKSIELENNKTKDKNLKKIKDIKLKSKKYFYYQDKYSLTDLENKFEIAKTNYFERIKNNNFKTNWKIKFFVYKNLNLNKANQIDYKKSKLLKNFEIDMKNDKSTKKRLPFSQLNCYLDAQLLIGLLQRKYVWNSPVSGSLILFKRFPNTFDPNITFSLNYLTV